MDNGYNFYCFFCDGFFENEKGHEDHLGGSYWIKDEWKKEIKKEVRMKKWNFAEGSGNLTGEASVREKVTFIEVSLWNHKSKDETKKKPKIYVDVAYFGKNKEAIDKLDLKKGQAVHFTGSLNNRKNSQGHTELKIIGYDLEIIKKRDLQNE